MGLKMACHLDRWPKVLEVLTASFIRMIIPMIVAVSTSETSVNLCETTRCNVPVDCNLHAQHSDNLKSHYIITFDKSTENFLLVMC
jgi:hypothetical protein